MDTKNSSEEWSANLAHELRSPISIIRGFAELLQDHPMEKATVQEIAGKIVHSSLRLETLIQSLLQLSDAKHARENFRQVPLLPLLEECKQTLPQAHISLFCDTPNIQVFGDEELLRLAFLNLLENSVKYSIGTANIQVSILQTASEAQITIQDEGIGIAAHHLPHIFDRFYSADKARSRKLGGAGLGLSIVKTILEKHSGSISVASECGKGTKFSIILPIDERMNL